MPSAPSATSSRFTPAAKNLDGQHADLGESFVYGNFSLGGMPLSLRLGRQTLLWGESLFFDQNGIAAGMAPVDYIKKTSTPDGYSRDVFLPVNQLSFTAQPAPDLSADPEATQERSDPAELPTQFELPAPSELDEQPEAPAQPATGEHHAEAVAPEPPAADPGLGSGGC